MFDCYLINLVSVLMKRCFNLESKGFKHVQHYVYPYNPYPLGTTI